MSDYVNRENVLRTVGTVMELVAPEAKLFVETRIKNMEALTLRPVYRGENEAEALKAIYKAFDYPPRDEKTADSDLVWNLLACGGSPRIILAALERILENTHPDDAYEEDEDEE